MNSGRVHRRTLSTSYVLHTKKSKLLPMQSLLMYLKNFPFLANDPELAIPKSIQCKTKSHLPQNQNPKDHIHGPTHTKALKFEPFWFSIKNPSFESPKSYPLKEETAQRASRQLHETAPARKTQHCQSQLESKKLRNFRNLIQVDRDQWSLKRSKLWEQSKRTHELGIKKMKFELDKDKTRQWEARHKLVSRKNKC